jgi:hypothetical protein
LLATTLYQGNPVGIKSLGISINKDVCTQYAGAAGMLLQIISKSENLIFIKHIFSYGTTFKYTCPFTFGFNKVLMAGQLSWYNINSR